MAIEAGRIVDVLWFNSGGEHIVGIVLYRTDHGHKMYIGSAPQYYPEELAKLHIANHGARFRVKETFPRVTDWYES